MAAGFSRVPLAVHGGEAQEQGGGRPCSFQPHLSVRLAVLLGSEEGQVQQAEVTFPSF